MPQCTVPWGGYAFIPKPALEKEVEKELLEDDDVKRAGILIHSFIIEAVHLDPTYEAEVKQKSVAQQKRLKEIELAAAAEESAKRVASEAKAQVETERAQAEAAKIKTVMSAEAERLASEQRAQGTGMAGIAASYFMQNPVVIIGVQSFHHVLDAER